MRFTHRGNFLALSDTAGDAEIDAFLQKANPQAHQAMQDRFRALFDAGLWDTRRNSIRADLERL